MPTIETIRARVRTRLEEAEAAVWSDDEIDEAVTATLEEYSHLFPCEDRVEVEVSSEGTSVDAPEDTFEVLRVVLQNGVVVPRRSSPLGQASDERLSWEWFAGAIHFSRPVGAQMLEVWRLTAYTVEQVPDADSGLLVLGGVWRALQQRSVQDLKRGGPLGGMSYGDVIRAAEREYVRALDRRRRRVRSRVMGAA